MTCKYGQKLRNSKLQLVYYIVSKYKISGGS